MVNKPTLYAQLTIVPDIKPVEPSDRTFIVCPGCDQYIRKPNKINSKCPNCGLVTVDLDVTGSIADPILDKFLKVI